MLPTNSSIKTNKWKHWNFATLKWHEVVAIILDSCSLAADIPIMLLISQLSLAFSFSFSDHVLTKTGVVHFQIVYNYLEQCYSAFLKGQDDFKELDDDLRRKLSRYYSISLNLLDMKYLKFNFFFKDDSLLFVTCMYLFMQQRIMMMVVT